jgi:hypothetical protein
MHAVSSRIGAFTNSSLFLLMAIFPMLDPSAETLEIGTYSGMFVRRVSWTSPAG